MIKNVKMSVITDTDRKEAENAVKSGKRKFGISDSLAADKISFEIPAGVGGTITVYDGSLLRRKDGSGMFFQGPTTSFIGHDNQRHYLPKYRFDRKTADIIAADLTKIYNQITAAPTLAADPAPAAAPAQQQETSGSDDLDDFFNSLNG